MTSGSLMYARPPAPPRFVAPVVPEGLQLRHHPPPAVDHEPELLAVRAEHEQVALAVERAADAGRQRHVGVEPPRAGPRERRERAEERVEQVVVGEFREGAEVEEPEGEPRQLRLQLVRQRRRLQAQLRREGAVANVRRDRLDRAGEEPLRRRRRSGMQVHVRGAGDEVDDGERGAVAGLPGTKEGEEAHGRVVARTAAAAKLRIECPRLARGITS